jgi:hypothetical protein
MRDDLENARRQAELADPSVRAAALLRIARAEFAGDGSRARQTLLEGIDAVRKLPGSVRDDLFKEAREVAAAVSPELLADIPKSQHEGHAQFGVTDDIVVIQTMLTHGHAAAAFDYLLRHDDPALFPFFSVGAVLHRLDPHKPESAARRTTLLNHAVEQWRQSLSAGHQSGRGPFGHHHGFVGFFSHFWKEFPPEEALSIARTIVDGAAEEPDAGTSAGYANGVHFSSPRQDTLFQILHVLRRLDPALAQSLIDAHDQLAAAARRYPNGLETIHEEAEEETKRRQAESAACEGGTCGGGGGYILTGDPKDFDRQRERQRQLMDAARSGEFETLIEDALEKYQEDTSPTKPNYAPKEYWPSTGAFRTVLYQAGKRLGAEAAVLLERIPDKDLRLFAAIEFAAALAGAPPSSIRSMKRGQPPGSQHSQDRIIAASSSTGSHRGLPMRSPDGRLIRCPKCRFQPTDDVRWSCKCGHVWNTFWTTGKCPACRYQWEITGCPQCGEMSEHRAWYESRT